jgi:hypothetical protein
MPHFAVHSELIYMNDETPTLISFQFIICNNEIKVPMHFQFHTGAMRQDKVPICFQFLKGNNVTYKTLCCFQFLTCKNWTQTRFQCCFQFLKGNNVTQDSNVTSNFLHATMGHKQGSNVVFSSLQEMRQNKGNPYVFPDSFT